MMTASFDDYDLSNLDLSAFTQERISELVGDGDPLDCEDFDPIAFLNNKFPDDSSLFEGGELSHFLNNCGSRLRKLKHGVSSAIQEDAIQRTQTEHAIGEAHNAISELFGKIKSIKSKAEQSERMVQEICRDIRKLDRAKKTLTDTIKAVKRLHMLMSAVHQLRIVTESKNYDVAANLLSAVGDLFEHFSEYDTIPQIHQLEQEVNEIRENLRSSIFKDFRTFDPNRVEHFAESTAVQHLQNACKVIEVLSPETEGELKSWMANSQLEVYKAIFGPGGDSSGLSEADQRFKYLKRQLRQFSDGWEKIFPEYWNMPGVLCKRFCDITSGHFRKVIEVSVHNPHPGFVPLLVSTLRKCVDFEAQMDKFYSLPNQNDEVMHLYEKYGLLNKEDEQSDDKEIDESERIKRKYKKQQFEEELTVLNKKHGKQVHSGVQPIIFAGILTSAFTDHMHHYVALEKSSISELIEKVDGDTNWWIPAVAECPDHFRHNGADEFLLYIKRSIQRCTKLSHEQTMFNVYKEYKFGLSRFCDMMSRYCFDPQNPNRKSNFVGDLISVCVLSNTADYISDTIDSLEHRLKETVSESKRDQVMLQDVKEEKYDTLATQALQSGMGFIMVALDPIWKRVPTERQWNMVEEVGDQSPFVTAIHNTLEHLVTISHDMISSKFSTFFDTNLCKSILESITIAMFRIKRVNTLGARQLQIDLQALKKTLLNLPNFTSSEKPRRVNSTFKKYVSKEIGRLEALIKTIGTPEEGLVDIFQSLIERGSFQDLSRICDIKGLPNKDRQHIIQRYNSLVPLKQQNKPMIPQEAEEKHWWKTLKL